MRVLPPRRGSACDLDRSVTAMVDVVFQLLVFFVIASAGRHAERSLSTTLSAGTVASTPAPPADKWVTDLWIHLRWDAVQHQTVIELNDRRYADLPALDQALKDLAELAPESPVILDIDPAVPVDDVVGLYDACRRAKFRSVNFSATPDEVEDRSRVSGLGSRIKDKQPR